MAVAVTDKDINYHNLVTGNITPIEFIDNTKTEMNKSYHDNYVNICKTDIRNAESLLAVLDNLLSGNFQFNRTNSSQQALNKLKEARFWVIENINFLNQEINKFK